MNNATRRLMAAASGGLLATAIVTGCGDSGGGGDDESNASGGGDYCGQVEEMKGEFESFSDPEYTLADISDTVDLVGDISESAPDDIASSWEALHSAMSDFHSNIADFGVDENAPLQEEFTKIAKDDPAKQQKIMKALSGMEDVQSDADKIEKQVKDECDIDLSESSDGAEDGGDSGS